MKTLRSPDGSDSAMPPALVSSSLAAPLTAGLLSWAAISLGFFGLKMLMQERPEFVGQPMRVTKAELVQESPYIVTRKVSDDISVIRPVQPEFSDVRFDMNGRRDYRGLRTIMDMSGQVRARYVLTNAFAEPIFILFTCPHPRSQSDDSQNLLAGELRLLAPTNGVQENTTNAWLWSGALEAHSSASIEISYHVAALKGVNYRVGDKSGNQVKHLRVTFQRKDLPSMRLESGDGAKRPSDEMVVWERKDFLAPDFFSAEIGESRNLFTSLSQLLEIGPLISLLFLLAASAAILVRQPLSAIQMLTIAAGYALYFPLILYLSSRFSFPVAMIIAVVAPGALLVNYARWLLGPSLGLIGAPVFLALYQVFPTLAAFAGWNRGMVLLWLGVVTLAVLINLQNRALKRKAIATAAAAASIAFCALPFNVNAADVQVTLPAELVTKVPDTRREITNSLVAFEPMQYRVRQEAGYLLVAAQAPFQIIRAGETTVPLFAAPVHLQEVRFDPADAGLAQLVTVTNRVALHIQRTGQAMLRLTYRAPITTHEGKKRVQIPVVLGASGNVHLESPRNDLEVLNGSLWTTAVADKTSVYDIGVAGLDSLNVEWRDQESGLGVVANLQTNGAKDFYGIGLTRAQNLTVINSDGSCTHFAEFDLPAFQTEEFRLRLPGSARLISVSVNGAEISSPIFENQLCRIRLPSRETQQTAHRLSFRIAYPAVRLGFVGTADLTLPEVFQTAGTLEWVVALPHGFDTQVISSGLETQKTVPDLGRFGDYGRILKSQSHTYLAKSLAPPGSVGLSLKYRQSVP
jgi:hypothetical protein